MPMPKSFAAPRWEVLTSPRGDSLAVSTVAKLDGTREVVWTVAGRSMRYEFRGDDLDGLVTSFSELLMVGWVRSMVERL